jgi:hypothetical protein
MWLWTKKPKRAATQCHKLAGAQPMAVGEQDRGGVPVAPTVAFRRLDQLVDLTLGQVLPLACWREILGLPGLRSAGSGYSLA